MSMHDGRGFVPGDFDRDGDIDFFVVNYNQPWDYLENKTGQTRSWLTVQLRGTDDNAFGIGAKVFVTRATPSGDLRQTRQIHVGSGYLSSPPPEAHFGLGLSSDPVRVDVTWPNGATQTFEGVETGRVLVIDQDEGIVGPAQRSQRTS